MCPVPVDGSGGALRFDLADAVMAGEPTGNCVAFGRRRG
jgi:hypothetical protein